MGRSLDWTVVPAAARARLLEAIADSGDVRDPRVLEALGRVPRERFVPPASVRSAYHDMALAIGHGQTISQPTVVGVMTEALELVGSERVLEIGTGSGYQAAVLALLAREVFSVEVVPALGEAAAARLATLAYANVHVRVGDGYAGWPEEAPFDRVLVTAAPERIPTALIEQLADGGVLVTPLGPSDATQELVKLRKRGGDLVRESLGAVRFVPMVPGRIERAARP